MARSQRLSSNVRRLGIVPAFVLLLLAAAACDAPDTAPSEGDQVVQLHVVENAGLQQPRAAIHDPVADVYLVSNQAGDPYSRDENGYISRVSPDGELLDAEWIPPFEPRGPISAPAGMALLGDSLFVADLDCVAAFHREEGTAGARRCLDGVTLLSGLAAGPDGSLFATDSGRTPDGGTAPAPSIYRLILEEGRQGSTLAQGAELGQPLGIDVGSRGIFVVTGSPGQILRFTPEGDRTSIMERPDARFEGVVFTQDGGFAYTSAEDATVYLVDATGAIHVVVEGIGLPGDLGYDATRNRLLVPVTDQDRLLLIDLR